VAVRVVLCATHNRAARSNNSWYFYNAISAVYAQCTGGRPVLLLHRTTAYDDREVDARMRYLALVLITMMEIVPFGGYALRLRAPCCQTLRSVTILD